MGPGQAKWQPIYFGVFSVAVTVNVVAALVFDTCAECSNLWEVVRAGGLEGATDGTVIVSAMEAFRIMIILPADYLTQKFVEPLRERQRQEGREEGIREGREEGIAAGREEGREEGIAAGRQEGREEGRAAGRAELRSEMLEWLRRRDEAQSQGLEFTEPMPGLDLNGSVER